MNLIEGKLKRLGESTVNMKNEWVKYSLIQIGDKTITNVMVDRKLNNFLQDGIDAPESTKLWMLSSNKIVMGVQVGTDTRYYGTINPFFYFAMVVHFALSLAAFNLHWGAGVFMLVIGWWFYLRKLVDVFRIAGVGGTKV